MIVLGKSFQRRAMLGAALVLLQLVAWAYFIILVKTLDYEAAKNAGGVVTVVVDSDVSFFFSPMVRVALRVSSLGIRVCSHPLSACLSCFVFAVAAAQAAAAAAARNYCAPFVLVADDMITLVPSYSFATRFLRRGGRGTVVMACNTRHGM